MSNPPLLAPSFELSDVNGGPNNSSHTAIHGTLFAAAAPSTSQRVFTRYTSDPGMTHSSSSSPPSSPCSLTAIDSSPPSSPTFGVTAEAGDDLDLDLDMNLDDQTVHMQLGGAEPKVRCVTPERTKRSRWAREAGNSVGKRNAPGNDLQTSPSHPYAASTRGVKRPPMYDKATSRAKIRRKNLSFESAGSDETSPSSSQNSSANAYMRPFTRPAFDPFAALSRPDNLYAKDSYMHDGPFVLGLESARKPCDPECDLWEETIANAVDGAESKIDLSGHNLTYVSPNISDLSNIVVFRGQDDSSPSSSSGKAPAKRTLSRSTTSQVFGTSTLGTQEGEINLFLGNNRISFLPHELFNIDALVVLSLRQNQLTEIPPLISQLRNLRELNVANNRLKYLPSEILSLKLTSLAIDPNPFMENPEIKGEKQCITAVERIHRIMPLAEQCLRVLIAPAEEDVLRTQSVTGEVNWRKTYKSQLEELYGFPLVTELPTSIEALLALCLPGSVPSERRGADVSNSPLTTPMTACSSTTGNRRVQSRPCISECTSPLHRLLVAGEAYQRPLFVEHAEERFTWEKEVAGQNVGGENGVPILWRGCSAGCLDYLDDVKKPDASEDEEMDWGAGPEVVVYAGPNPEPDLESPVVTSSQLTVEDDPAGPPFSSEGFEFDDDD